MQQPVKLYPPGTKLADVPPEFRGCSWKQWQLQTVEELIQQRKQEKK
jgi:hypothetical protein